MKTRTTSRRARIDPERWTQLKDILADALEQDSRAARAAFVETRCGNDAALLAEAQSLIGEAEASLSDDTDLLEECADQATRLLWSDESPRSGWRIGAYVVTRELGRGGMGTVYLARRADGQFEKEVAIKVLKRGTDTDEVLRRFAAERHILAQLDHPNIAHLLDAGTTDDGLPYFVMEYVAGTPITRFVRDHQLSVDARVALFLKVCAAVEVAHCRHVVHRDLKPSNILVNAAGEPKLLDFGIAKLLTPGDDWVDLTAVGEERLTPACASPEQTDGRPINRASDVYALGALLYELLTGNKPHKFETAHPSREEIGRVIREQDAAPPSSVAERATARLLRGDLDAIVLFALRKEPECRYATAAELSADLRRYLASEPVVARRHTIRYRAKCLLKRNQPAHRRAVVSVVLLVLAAVAIVLWDHAARRPANLTKPALPQADLAAPNLPKSIAVLPFDNFGHDNSSSYFADGVQDNILTDLGKIGDLKVVSRSAVAGFRGEGRNVKEIGRKLGVSNVLEGSVQISGQRVRINAQLVDTQNETQVWAEHYDRKVEDIFALQSELAQTIAAQLNATLSAREKAAIWKRPTEDMQAYDLYLRARAKMNAFGSAAPRDWNEAVTLLKAATARDPKFTLAYCLLNDFDTSVYRWGRDHSPERLAEAKAAAETALKLDAASEEARLASARYYYRGLSDYARTQEELSKLPASGAHTVEYYTLASLVQRRLGLWEDTVRNGEKAVELDPQDPSLAFNLAQTLTGLKRYSDSERLLNSAILRLAPSSTDRLWALKDELEVARGDLGAARAALDAMKDKHEMDFVQGHLWLCLLQRDFGAAREVAKAAPEEVKNTPSFCLTFAMTARSAGNSEEARAAFEATRSAALRVLGERPDAAEALTDLAVADAALGRNDDAVREAQRAVELVPTEKDAVAGPLTAAMLAEVFGINGDHDRALKLLHQLVAVPFGPSYGDLKFDPMWDDLRPDPVFQRILKQSELIVAVELKPDAAPR